MQGHVKRVQPPMSRALPQNPLEHHLEVPQKLDEQEAHQKSLKDSLGSTTKCATTFELIKSWLSTCIHSHRVCSEQKLDSSPTPPTRLILLSGSSHTARLVEANNNFGQSLAYHLNTVSGNSSSATKTRSPPYIALSYRWGASSDTSRLLLTSATKLQLETGVSFDLLPHTIRDACTVVLKLGYEYLWVDRLCIFQDSEQDWHSEASRMANVYKHAVLTISASAAAGEDAGFFRERRQEGANKRSRRRAARRKERQKSEKYARSLDGGQRSCCTKERLGHLADRGWVFQERLLSTRIVHFASDDVHWECGCLETNAMATYRSKMALDRPFFDVGSATLSGKTDHERRGRWGRLVEQYSRLKLTFESDRLPALSAVAREMEREIRRASPPKVMFTNRAGAEEEKEYYAGMWKSTFLADLCWQYAPVTQAPAAGHQLEDQSEYAAPSWSWASQSSREVRWSQIPLTPETEYLAKVTRVGLLHVGDDIFGAVQDGFMAISGRSVPITILSKEPDRDIEGGRPAFEVHGRHNEPLPFITCTSGAFEARTLQEQLVTRGFVQCWCLPLCQYKHINASQAPDDPPSDVAWCLLIAPHGTMRYKHTGKSRLEAPRHINSGTFEYQRVGWVELEIQRIERWEMWMSEAPERYSVIR